MPTRWRRRDPKELLSHLFLVHSLRSLIILPWLCTTSYSTRGGSSSSSRKNDSRLDVYNQIEIGLIHIIAQSEHSFSYYFMCVPVVCAIISHPISFARLIFLHLRRPVVIVVVIILLFGPLQQFFFVGSMLNFLVGIFNQNCFYILWKLNFYTYIALRWVWEIYYIGLYIATHTHTHDVHGSTIIFYMCVYMLYIVLMLPSVHIERVTMPITIWITFCRIALCVCARVFLYGWKATSFH